MELEPTKNLKDVENSIRDIIFLILTEKYGDKCNYITIAHDDDKISQYIHLENFSLTNSDEVKK